MGVDWAHILLVLMFVGVWVLIFQFTVKGDRGSIVSNATVESKVKGNNPAK